MPLLVLGSAWLAGVFLGATAQPPLPVLVGLAGGAGAAALIWMRRRADRLSALAFLAFLLGLARYEAHAQALAAREMTPYLGSTVSVIGLVDEAPDRRGKAQRLVVAVRSMAREGQDHAVAGWALVTLPPLPQRHYGDVLRLSGRLQAPPVFPDFDYREYLSRQGISAVMPFPRVELVATAQGNPVRAALIAVRDHLAGALATQLPEPHAALAQGIVFGQRAAIPPDLNAAFARTGTAHLLAISGQNLTLAAALAVAWGSRVFGRRHPLYYLGVLGSVWAYSFLVGLPASVVRAALMASLAVVAAGLGRPGGGLAVLVAAAALMVAVNPLLLWDVSFQLSFLAMAGVLFLAPVLEAIAWRLPGLRTLAQREGTGQALAAFLVAGLAATLGASLTTLPVVWNAFRAVPILALPATVFGLLAFPVIMAAGALTAVLTLASPLLGIPFAWLTWGSTAWLLAVVGVWAEVPLAAVSAGRPPAAVWWAYSALLFGVLAGLHRVWYRTLWRPTTPRLHLRLPAASRLRAALQPPFLAGLILAGAILTLGWGGSTGGVRLWFLDGGGDAVLLRAPSGMTALIGGSPDPGALARALGRVLPFWQRDLDLVLLPAPTRDYLPGLLLVLERYRVGQVMEGEGAPATVEYREWGRRIRGQGMERTRLRAGLAIGLGDGLTLRVLASPPAGGMALGLEGLGGAAVLLDRGASRAFAAGGLDLGRNEPVSILKLAWRAGDRPLDPALLEPLQLQALIVAGTPSPLPQDTVGAAEVYAVPSRGTVELSWEDGTGWLRTER